MPYKRLPRITRVAAGEQPYTLRIAWDHGDESLVDVSRLISTYRVYTPLRHAPDLFRQVRVGEYGTDIVWTDDLDMSAAFHAWRLRKDYTLDDAAAALGVSRRIVVHYDLGDKPIPRPVALATLAIDQLDLGCAKPW